ncbi:hypothetical protein LC613_16920 [Nostoc sphaeroides CHAB 2801]|nr:hypothetical protein [Nostoc sphaeroides]MCC5629640.1 hypothetical protein [Nostoc sphaeroides CHAB 2801]
MKNYSLLQELGFNNWQASATVTSEAISPQKLYESNLIISRQFKSLGH